MLRKITYGFVVQTYDPAQRRFIDQRFSADSDAVDYETEDGEAVDSALFVGLNGREAYLPFAMQQPSTPGLPGTLVSEVENVWRATAAPAGEVPLPMPTMEEQMADAIDVLGRMRDAMHGRIALRDGDSDVQTPAGDRNFVVDAGLPVSPGYGLLSPTPDPTVENIQIAGGPVTVAGQVRLTVVPEVVVGFYAAKELLSELCAQCPPDALPPEFVHRIHLWLAEYKPE